LITGIVGFSPGVGHIRLDDEWGFDSDDAGGLEELL